MNAKIIMHEIYEQQKALPFVWGVSDCLAYCATVAQAMTGRDVMTEIPAYDSEIAAKRVMIEKGWRSLADLAAEFFDEIPVGHAQSGDWAFAVNNDGTETLGVVNGAVIVARGERGLVLLPLLQAKAAFRVS